MPKEIYLILGADKDTSVLHSATVDTQKEARDVYKSLSHCLYRTVITCDIRDVKHTVTTALKWLKSAGLTTRQARDLLTQVFEDRGYSSSAERITPN